MPSPITVNIKMKPHLIRFIENKYGPQPIEFPRKDRHAAIIPQLLRRPMKNENQFESYGAENLKVVLPYNEEKNVLYHNFIPASAQTLFQNIINRAFLAEFHDFMNDAQACSVGITESVNVFIDINRLDPIVFDMLIKERQRYKSNQRLAKWRNKKSRQLTQQFVNNDTE